MAPPSPSPDLALQREVLHLLAGKWTLQILAGLLAAERLRFGQLRRLLGSISQRMLTQTLRQLERDGLVRRRESAGRVPTVEYTLTPLGLALRPLLETIEAWGSMHLPRIEQARCHQRAPRGRLALSGRDPIDAI